MRALGQVTLLIALVGFLAAVTLMSVVAVGDAMIAVTFTTFGTDDSLVAGEWDLCDGGFESVACG
jgi:hypothetical protein